MVIDARRPTRLTQLSKQLRPERETAEALPALLRHGERPHTPGRERREDACQEHGARCRGAGGLARRRGPRVRLCPGEHSGSSAVAALSSRAVGSPPRPSARAQLRGRKYDHLVKGFNRRLDTRLSATLRASCGTAKTGPRGAVAMAKPTQRRSTTTACPFRGGPNTLNTSGTSMASASPTATLCARRVR